MLHPDATTIRLIHQHMIEEELARHRRPDRDDADRPGGRWHQAMTVRRATARALRAVARWIEPTPRVDGAMPPTTPAM